jgi:hypothetical protein
LKLPGYSAYLHPASDTTLIGVGQSATDGGRATGTQVSLFDVSNLDDPSRLANYTLPCSYSQAEFDPHAFLYLAATGMLVIPLHYSFAVPMPATDTVTPPVAGTSGSASGSSGSARAPAATPTSAAPDAGSPNVVATATPPASGKVGTVPAYPPSGALVLRIDGGDIVEVGFLNQPAVNGYSPPIERSLIIDRTLWTVSGELLMASDANTLARLAVIPLA